jgi:recombination protein RecT
MAAGLKDKVDQAKVTQALAKPTSTVMSIFQDTTIKTQLSAALGASTALTAERLLVVALNEIRRNAKLLDCTRESFVGALLLSAHLGLEVGGPLGHFYMVPFKNTKRGITEVVPILGYKGMIVLARRSAEVEDVVAREVCENDRFEFAYGIEDKLVHVPAEGDRGKPVRFYGIARFTNGGHLVRVMSVAEVNKFRDRSRAKDDGPWVTDYVAMGSKTVIRRMAAYMPLTTEAATAISEDEERELGLTPEGVLDLEALGYVLNGTAPASSKGVAAKAVPAADTVGEPEQPPPAATSAAAGLVITKPADAHSGGWVATIPGAAAGDAPLVCQICGATGVTHDDAKHAAAAAAKRKAKPEAAAAEEGGGAKSKEQTPEPPPSSAPSEPVEPAEKPVQESEEVVHLKEPSDPGAAFRSKPS